MTTEVKITNLKKIPNTGFVTEVGYSIEFTLEGIKEYRNGTVYYETGSEGSGYIPFEELTKEEVVNWVETTIGAEKIENLRIKVEQNLTARLERESALSGSFGMPW
jgi:hypothetical protein